MLSHRAPDEEGVYDCLALANFPPQGVEMNLLRTIWQIFLLACMLSLLPATGFAQDKSTLRVILKGHDPVAYFTDGRPVKGSPEISYDWDEGRYYFASAKNRDLFKADPDRYAPRFAGYCTGSMARGVRNEGNPEAWIVADGKLYVFGGVKYRDMAASDRQQLAAWIEGAKSNWAKK
jgi:YHS domain-containing protein